MAAQTPAQPGVTRLDRRIRREWLGVAAALLVLAGVPFLPVTVVVVVLIAIAMNLSYPSTVTLSQSFLPNHLGTASGISYGLATCVGGIASPGLGLIGDSFGLTPVLVVMAGAAALSLIFALVVVRDERLHRSLRWYTRPR